MTLTDRGKLLGLLGLLCLLSSPTGAGIIYKESAGGGGGGGTIFSENCSSLSEWTAASSGSASVDVVANQCLGNLAANFEDAAILQGPLDSTSEFCSMKVITINTADSNKVGCIFRAPATPGVHYSAFFNNGNGSYLIENQTAGHDFVDGVLGGTNCGCSAYVDIGNNDYIGITLSGTGSSTTVNWWDFGSSAPSDLEDPGTWGDAHTVTCTCSTSEIATVVTAENFTLIDVAGDCGPEMTGLAASEITIDDFACGDTP
jgi:hypothetical protein